MTPKEKALELFDKFIQFTPVEFELEYTKECALIAVDEIIKTCPQKENEIFAISKGLKFWKEVKIELNKL